MKNTNLEMIGATIDRIRAELPEIIANYETISLMMDLESVPDLDFAALNASDNFTFAHDVCGIIRHMDRTSYPGQLTDFFEPRCTRKQTPVLTA